MRADAGLHPNQARRQIGEPRFNLATRPLLAQYDRATLFVPYDVDVFLPISMPITAILLLGVWGSAMLLLSSVPRASFDHWRGWSTAGPSH